MFTVIKKLATMIVLLVVASGIILGVDLWQQKKKASSVHKLPVIGFVQNNSMPVVDQGIDGLIAGLENSGYIKDVHYVFEAKNAMGDSGTLQQIAAGLANGDSDLVITYTTPAVQTFAAANKQTQKKHVFALVTDPWAVGIGLVKEPPSQPAYMTGIGTMQPVKGMFEMARKLNPNFKRVGLVWNTAELNSEINTKIGRVVAKEMGFELKEGTATGTSEVGTAVEAVLSKGVDFVWISGDTTAIAGTEVIVSACRKAGVPVISNIPGLEGKGVLACVGANYNMVGHRAGEMAAKVLQGQSPGSIPVEALIPEVLTFNIKGIDKLKDRWTVPPDMKEKAAVFISDEGTIDKRPKPKRVIQATPVQSGAAPGTTQPATAPGGAAAAPKARAKAMPRPVNIHLVLYSDAPPLEQALAGLKDIWRKAGMTEGKDYRLTYTNAFMDAGVSANALARAESDKAEIIFVMGTPALQAAIKRFKSTPVVFCCVSEPFMAGVGKSNADKQANVTGVMSLAAYDEAADLLAKYYPKVKRVGTVYNPNELNSVVSKDHWKASLSKHGIELEEVAAMTPAEVGEAARALCTKDIQMMGQIIDNLTGGNFNSIVAAANKAKLPIFCFTSATSEAGAMVSIARDYHDMGMEAGKMSMEIMAGKSPADIAIIPLPQHRLIVNVGATKKMGYEIPKGLIDRADKVLE
jgi:ABC-type uncharacterized transport system substrate-binding protein